MNTINSKYKQLITRVLSGEASAAEKERLDRWLARSEEHGRVYEQYKRIWELEPETPAEAEFDTQHAWQNVLTMIESGETDEKGETVKLPRSQLGRRFFINKMQNLYWISGVAAAFLILITTSLFFFLRSPQTEMLALVADHGDELFALDDGSLVHLRESASLNYPEQFKGNKRPVFLEGSAWFEVAKDSQRPFIITTRYAIIEVLGTSFYVEAHDDRLSVYVSGGSIQLQSTVESGPEAILSRGETGTLMYKQQKILVSSQENMNFLAWKTGKLEFFNEPLAEVFKALEETYNISINAPGEVMNLQLTGRFQDETAEDVLKSIGLVFGFETIRNNSDYTIRTEYQNIK